MRAWYIISRVLSSSRFCELEVQDPESMWCDLFFSKSIEKSGVVACRQICSWKCRNCDNRHSWSLPDRVNFSLGPSARMSFRDLFSSLVPRDSKLCIRIQRVLVFSGFTLRGQLRRRALQGPKSFSWVGTPIGKSWSSCSTPVIMTWVEKTDWSLFHWGGFAQTKDCRQWVEPVVADTPASHRSNPVLILVNSLHGPLPHSWWEILESSG